MSTIASLLTILLLTFHVTDDILRNQGGSGEGGALNLIVPLILIVWLYGTLVLAEQRSGYIIKLVGSLFAALPGVGHLTGWGDVVVGDIAKSSGTFFVWTVIALSVSAIFSLILSVQELRSLQSGQSR